MPLSINRNIAALNVSHRIGRNQSSQEGHLEAIGSGLRIKRASNDAAGLSISEGFRAQVTRLSQNVKNAEQGTDLLKVAEGSLQESTSLLQRMRTLATQSANGHLTDKQREVLTSEFDQATAAIDRIAQATVYNGQVLLAGFAEVDKATSTAFTDATDTGVAAVRLSGADVAAYQFTDSATDDQITLGNGVITQTIDMGVLLDGDHVAEGTKVIANFDRLGVQLTLAGTGAAKLTGVGEYASGDLDGKSLVIEAASGGSFQVGPSTGDADLVEFDLADLRASGNLLDLGKTSLSSQASSRLAMEKIDTAINRLSQERGRIGALINRLDHSIEFSENEIENMVASESAVRDADIAYESSRLARSQILSGSSRAMLTQAFASSRQVLDLL
ncbi:MAG: flagellin [Gemmatimonadetes bacterium]|jgi:flagellin|nr:flagellin [Gemmatimonadota bacterium]MBT4612465.1 flagellin [Gemmatimonadota bacterium]MBT5055360.1 flagellin [Gemmatimonadota bacterium]MBT5144995.1 flagellin [Gemmatimonadota bacterium]MBT5590297.1 flagellin [Gemmatimonadota bacterium]